jgi:hypothetical protein
MAGVVFDTKAVKESLPELDPHTEAVLAAGGDNVITTGDIEHLNADQTLDLIENKIISPQQTVVVMSNTSIAKILSCPSTASRLARWQQRQSRWILIQFISQTYSKIITAATAPPAKTAIKQKRKQIKQVNKIEPANLQRLDPKKDPSLPKVQIRQKNIEFDVSN